MSQLFNAFLFKIKRDLTFRITLFIGIGLAIFMTLLFVLLEQITKTKMLSGELMLVTSLNPAQNFGLAIPVNLITFTVLEFNQGSIRNKIIAGHSKAKVYTSLFLNGLIFAFSLIIVYSLLCFALGSLIGGVEGGGMAMSLVGASYAKEYIYKIIIVGIFTYLSITSFTIFFSTLFRSIGPAIPVVIVTIVFLSLVGTLVGTLGGSEELVWILRIIDPLYGLGAAEVASSTSIVDGVEVVTYYQDLTIETFVSSIISNLVYTALFFVLGISIFKKRDIK